MRFDLRTISSTKKFVSEWLAVEIEDVEEYIFQNHDSIDLDNFCEYLNIDLEDVTVKDITFVASHITTSIDNLKSIKEYGLMDLQTVLTENTPLYNFFEVNKIKFDIKEKNMKYKSDLYNVEYNSERTRNWYDSESLEGRLISIGHKLYYDNQISAFFSMEGDKSYGGYVHIRPEFIFNVGNVCNEPLEKEWNILATAYVLEFEEEFENFEWFSFYDTRYDYLNDFYSKELLKEWIVYKLLYRLRDDAIFGDISDTHAYMKPSYIIPWSKIINVRKIV